MAPTTKRKKVTLIENVTAEQAEQALSVYAETEARHAEITADIDARVAKIRDSYTAEIAELQETQTEQFSILQNYAVNNRDAFGDKKSMDLPDGKIGFRTGTPALKTLPGYTWASATTLIAKYLKPYVKMGISPNKEKLLSDRDLAAVNKHFEKCGIAVAQAETFFVEPKILQEA